MKFFKNFLAALLAVVVGSFVTVFVWIGAFSSMMSSFGTTPVVVEDNSILKIDFSESVVDAPSTNPFAGFDLMSMTAMPSVSLYDALRAIDAAANDERIKGIYLNLDSAGTADGLAIIEELRTSIENFKKSGKFVVAFDDMYVQSEYYLASVADKIYMHPEGSFMWQGLYFNNMFFTGLFEKLGVDVEIFRPTVCKYKSAVEPYFLKKMSPANRLQMQELADSMWATISSQVAASRNISVEELNRITDNLEIAIAEDALSKGLVDELAYEDQLDNYFEEKGVERGDDDEYNYISLGEYISQLAFDVDKLSADKVAIVYAQGEITDGEDTQGAGDMIYGNTLAAELADVRKDESIKAVVLRVNSPGGSALASDIIWREMELLRKEKPVIVSMGGYAASGGYYISAPADAIVADKMTLTGSIGVFGMMMNPTRALERNLGITFDGVKSNKSADMGMPGRNMTKQERAYIMRGVDKVYGRFTSLVAEGRNLPVERVYEIAEGRVWSGSAAQEIGLVDMCGGLKDAIAVAADKASLSNYRVIEHQPELQGMAALFSQFGAQARASFEMSQMGEFYSDLKSLRESISQNGIVMYSSVRVDF